MRTLIELFDERPLDNVLSAEMFRPERTVYICPREVARDQNMRESLERYFRMRGVDTACEFLAADMLNPMEVSALLKACWERYPDAAIDISGGTDSALFAAGLASNMPGASVFTYSRRKNMFFEIMNAPFAHDTPCTVHLRCADCFLMAGGEMLPGREDNTKLAGAMDEAMALWNVYVRFRPSWHKIITYIQRISQGREADNTAEGDETIKGDRGTVTADADCLQALADAGLIRDLRMSGGRVFFRFRDDLVRFWLRDVGSALEVCVYTACARSGFFDDVCLSAVVNWHYGPKGSGSVTNEIDVMAVQDVRPVFISCKATDIKTEALNELKILRDRFGGEGSFAAIVTTSAGGKDNLAMRNRAQELGIRVFSLQDAEEPEKLARYLKNMYR